MKANIEYCCVSHKGLVRKSNQDNFLCEGRMLEMPCNDKLVCLKGNVDSEQNLTFAVFDGMGGEQHGDLASRIAAETFYELMSKKRNDDFFVTLQAANKRIVECTLENNIFSMGTTAAAIRFGVDRIHICNIGDSRIYRIRNGTINCLSKDHVLSSAFGKKPPLYQYLGMNEQEMLIEPFISTCEYRNDDIFLICSDGLTDMLSEVSIGRILMNNSLEAASKILLDESLNRGGVDNITFLIFDIKREKEMNNLMDISNVWPEYETEKMVGRGAYGAVYKIVNKINADESYAVKVLSIPMDELEAESLYYEGMTEENAKTYYKEVVNDFISEINMMEILKDCPNIVKIKDYKVVEKQDAVGFFIYVRMEMLTPLNVYMSDKKLSENDVLKIGCDLLNALEVCNAHNIIHRDIKPENVFVDSQGNFKLGDFGIAKKMESATASLSQKGTFNYMAPEVISSIDYDARVDIYSLGILLYKMLNDNRLPFVDTKKQLLSPTDRKNALERRIRGEQLPAPVAASNQVADIILKACAFEPKDRFATASEMKSAIESLLQKNEKIIEPSVNSAKVMKKNKTGISPILFVAVLLICIVIFGVMSVMLYIERNHNGVKDNALLTEQEADFEINPEEDYVEAELSNKELSDKYIEAKECFKKGNYENAKELYAELGDYSDSAEMVKECDYQVAYGVMKKGDFFGAKNMFLAIDDYEKAREMANKCDYENAKELAQKGDYKFAREMFEALGGYSDAKYQAKKCYLEQGCDYIKRGDEENAGQFFIKLIYDEEWLNEFSKAYGGVETEFNVTDYSGQKEVVIYKRDRYWHNGVAAIVIDYFNEPDENGNLEMSRFTIRPDDGTGEGIGFFDYSPSGELLTQWIFNQDYMD